MLAVLSDVIEHLTLIQTRRKGMSVYAWQAMFGHMPCSAHHICRAGRFSRHISARSESPISPYVHKLHILMQICRDGRVSTLIAAIQDACVAHVPDVRAVLTALRALALGSWHRRQDEGLDGLLRLPTDNTVMLTT